MSHSEHKTSVGIPSDGTTPHHQTQGWYRGERGGGGRGGITADVLVWEGGGLLILEEGVEGKC